MTAVPMIWKSGASLIVPVKIAKNMKRSGLRNGCKSFQSIRIKHLVVICMMLKGLRLALVAVTLLATLLVGQPKIARAASYKVVGYIQSPFIGYLGIIELNKLTHLIYTDIRPAADDNATLLSPYDGWNNIIACVSAGHAAGIKVLASLYLNGTDGSYPITDNATLRATLVSNISSAITTYSLDGIDINWEGSVAYDHDTGLENLINNLYTAIHPSGKIISVTGNQLPLSTGFDITVAESAKVEFISILTYDLAVPIHAPYAEDIVSMAAWGDAGYDKSKLLFGIPFYGYDNAWTGFFFGTITDNLTPLSSQNSANVSAINGVVVNGGFVWWNGIDLAKQKMDWVIANGYGGAMCYDVGEDKLSSDNRSLLYNIYNELNTVILVSIAVTPSSPANLQIGSTQQFAVIGTYSDSSNSTLTTSVTWVSSNTSIASISAGGLVTGIAAGSTNISANMTGIYSSNITLTVKALASIAVTPNPPPDLSVGFNRQFTAIGTYTDSSTENLTTTATWATSNNSAVTISSTGLATGIVVGSANLTASQSGITSSSVTQNVTTSIPSLVSISVTPTSVNIRIGGTQQFTAIGTYSDSSILDVTSAVNWTSSNSAIAAISSVGLATGYTIGSITISSSLSSVSGNNVALSVVTSVGTYSAGTSFAQTIYPIAVVIAPLLIGLKIVSESEHPLKSMIILMIVITLVVAFLPTITEALNAL
jgi:hypothetical protein